jgi:hypothetical protein
MEISKKRKAGGASWTKKGDTGGARSEGKKGLAKKV